MSNNMDDLFTNVKKMVDSGNIPEDLKNMVNQVQNSSNSQNSFNKNTTNSSDINEILKNISPEMVNNLNTIMNSNKQNRKNTKTTQNNDNTNNLNFDINTIMKMKSVMDNMNNNNDPRANLLYSLKPYLRDSKKEKLDQYVNLLNISKIADAMNKKGNNNDK